jgi:hypothetical protein
LDSNKSLLIIAANLAAGLLLSSCNGGASLTASGHYEGFVVDSSDVVQTQTSIGADAKVSGNSVLVQIKAEPSGTVVGLQELDLSFQLSDSSDDLVLSANGSFLSKAISLKKKGNCYVGATEDTSPGASKNTICLSGNEITLSLSSPATKFVLDKLNDKLDGQSGNKKSETSAAVLEEPASYTVDQLVERAKTENFNDQVAFKQVVQARDTAKTAYLNLLPHLNINVGMDIEAGVTVEPIGFLTIARSIGDLVPFVLPNHWFQANSLKDTAEADVDAYKIVQASSMNIVHGLALSVLRDEEAVRNLKEKKVAVLAIRDEILAIVQNGGGLPIGSADQIDGVLNKLDSSIETLKEDAREEKKSLSQSVGFVNPEAIDLVQAIDTTGFGPITGDSGTWQAAAEQRSLALIQADLLIASSKQTKDSLRFQWLDPSGDDQGSVGFGMKSYVGAGQAAVDQLKIGKVQTDSVLRLNVVNTLTQSTSLYKQYKIALGDVGVQQGIVDHLMTNLRTGIFQTADLTTLATALSTESVDVVNQTDDEFALLTLQDEINFLTFSGVYASLLSGS